ncbi:NADH:flavin oxidoreductase/NADH oxidase [Ereboglobus luteus]|uniref:Oxidoreductase n=1 Tax=Ereboglobus luteus TaxID=1796921 RepID=A0A2U8E035_9BACT|nr:NADH:flavin oxidoreductase/NADH oxidase [Ereboglobus luteus]AWI08213.1 oxidoreductase [Ereboglobus luteus]
MSILHTPFSLKSVTIRNRVGVSPMCMFNAQDGLASDWHLAHYGARAIGGAGLIIVEATAVEARGRITANDLGIWSDAHVEPLARINRFIKAQGTVPGMQIAHAGRKGSISTAQNGGQLAANEPGGWEIIGPSAVAFGGALGQVPREMTIEDIRAVQDAFFAAAKRALAAGVEWLEIHAAHGYLAHSFYSPLGNRRADNYGGVFENRIRFLMETVAGVRAVWPETLPLTVRISATDWADERGGWTLEDSVALAKRLKAAGIDLVDTSTGGGAPDAKIPVAPGYQVPFAERIRREAGIATAAVGLITDAAQAEEILREGRADIVLIGRESLRDPNWPQRAARELGADVKAFAPGQYARAW